MGDFPSTLDAVAFGYLSLCTKDNLEMPALSFLISSKFPKLLLFVKRMEHLLDVPESKDFNEESNKKVEPISKSMPLFIVTDDPDSVKELFSNLAELVSPRINRTFDISILNALNPFSWYWKPEKHQNRGKLNNFIKPSQFMLGSLFIVLGFISSKRIFFSYADDDIHIVNDESDDVLNQIGTSSDLLSGFFDNNADSNVSSTPTRSGADEDRDEYIVIQGDEDDEDTLQEDLEAEIEMDFED
ncbi:hypothetical protein AYI68_g3629 [Smittium mucronatum]|uniref:Metaxin glutathione S-transferase domain-containing protein n=1 Tax=Smittium mucronatum TaxID=133383 RepID=A0A1R0GZB8_9FUNG|nr:hypothetical protein AYI68_g3629 [Smittium mucronatum]